MPGLYCLKCGQTAEKPGFARWQIIVSIVFFPVGLLSLLLGRKPVVCRQCGQKLRADSAPAAVR